MTLASFSYFLLFFGVLFYEDKKIHIPLVLSAVFIDLGLVLILEIKRSAIATMIEGNLNIFQKGHVILSSMAVAFYIPTVILGALAVYHKNMGKIKIHRYLGRIAFFLRTCGFFLMFSLLEHVTKN